MIIGITGAIVGQISNVQPHPQGTRIWLADVELGNVAPVRIVFGGDYMLHEGDLVPVAPPGSRIKIRADTDSASAREKRIRVRRYRGVRSHGMLCSLGELGWIRGGPNEVATLRDVTLAQSLDDIPAPLRPEFVKDWERAKKMEMEATAGWWGF